jgi:transcriptional regulator with XRE-family HTH domain
MSAETRKRRMMQVTPQIGATMRAWRTFHQLTQAELARRVGVNPRDIASLERSHTVHKAALLLDRIALGLGVSRRDLELHVMPDPDRVMQDAGTFRSILQQAGSARPLDIAVPMAPANNRIIYGTEETMQAAIHLLQSVPKLDAPHSQQIVITWQGSRSIIDTIGDSKIRERWVAAFTTVLDRGWDIVHLVHVSDLRKAHLIMLNILALLGRRGLYVPRLLPAQPETNDEQRDYVVVLGKGALELVGVESAIYHDAHEDDIEVLWTRVTALREASLRVYNMYPRRMMPDFMDAIARVDEQPGDRYLVMNGLSESTVPLNLHADRAKLLISRGGAAADFARHAMQTRMEREQAIRRQLAVWRYRDICPRQAIQREVDTGIYSLDDAFLEFDIPALSREQTITHFNALIDRLMEYENYELILLPDSEVDYCRTFYLAKAGYEVLLESWRPGSDGMSEEIDIEVTDPTIVQAFYDNPAWGSYLRPSRKRKQDVIRFLRKQVSVLEKRVAPVQTGT